MSMTREEAIAVLVESKRQNEVMRDNPSTFWASHQMADGVKNTERRIAALDMALSALRPVSREQVEKMRGEWIADGEKVPVDENGCPRDGAKCSVCGEYLTASEEYDCTGHFCPACGSPMTDKAVDMVMERLEALNNEG